MNTSKLLSLAAIVSALSFAPSTSDADSIDVHTALTEFDACLPLPDGRVVAGSAGGLLVVDNKGRQEALYTALDGLPGTKVHSIEMSGNSLWVGTNLGAARIAIPTAVQKGVASAEQSPLFIQESFASKPVRDILIDGKAVVAATWGQGVVRWQDAKLSTVHKGDSMSASRVTSIAKIGGEYQWTTAGAGLWSKGLGAAKQNAAFPAKAMLWTVEGKTTKSALVAGQAGVFSLKGESQSSSLYSVRALDIEGDTPLVASFGYGLRTLRGAKVNAAPRDPFVRSLRSAKRASCMGTQDALWIRAKNSSSWAKAELANSLPANDIAAFVSDGTQTYVGTFDQGVARLRKGRFEKIATRHDPHVNALALDKRDGALWIATSSELIRLHKGRASRFNKRNGLPSKHVMSLYAMSGGGVLVGTAHGAALVQDGMVEVLGGKVGIRTGNVWAVAQTSDGANWLGTTRGLFRVRNGNIDRYRVISGELKDDWVMALAPSSDGIFVGTYKAGVVRLRTKGREVVATQLGEGWVNPGGLHWDGKRLRAATMYGAFEGNGISADWTKEKRVLGMDTTVFVPGSAGDEWVVTRNGLSRQLSKLTGPLGH